MFIVSSGPTVIFLVLVHHWYLYNTSLISLQKGIAEILLFACWFCVITSVGENPSSVYIPKHCRRVVLTDRNSTFHAEAHAVFHPLKACEVQRLCSYSLGYCGCPVYMDALQ